MKFSHDHTRKSHHIQILKQGARFRSPDLHLSGAQFATESVDTTSGQLWTGASVVTDAFFTALDLTSSNFIEVAGGGYGEVVGLRYTHAYVVFEREAREYETFSHFDIFMFQLRQ